MSVVQQQQMAFTFCKMCRGEVTTTYDIVNFFSRGTHEIAIKYDGLRKLEASVQSTTKFR